MPGFGLRGHCLPGQEAGGGGDGAISARALHDAEGALRSGGALRRDAVEDRGDRFEGVVDRGPRAKKLKK